MLTLIGFITLLFSTVLYNKYLRRKEFRSLFKYAIYVGFIGSVTSFIFVMRWNVTYLYINDLVFIIFTSIVTDILVLSFSNLPSMVLFAKITPKHIEATVFALLTGTSNLANGVLSPMVGAWINDRFVKVTADDLSNFYILVII
jgi:vacuolar-type H+-ATPase subunit I/STV1